MDCNIQGPAAAGPRDVLLGKLVESTLGLHIQQLLQYSNLLRLTCVMSGLYFSTQQLRRIPQYLNFILNRYIKYAI